MLCDIQGGISNHVSFVLCVSYCSITSSCQVWFKLQDTRIQVQKLNLKKKYQVKKKHTFTLKGQEERHH